MPEVRQGEVWKVAFQEGWERPAIIVSRNELNKGRLLLVAPCTSSRVAERKILPNHVLIPAGMAGLTTDCVVQCHLIQPVEAGLLLERLGVLSPAHLSEVLLALAWTTALFEGIALGL